MIAFDLCLLICGRESVCSWDAVKMNDVEGSSTESLSNTRTAQRVMTTRSGVVAFGAPDVPSPCTVNPDLNGFSAIPETPLEPSCAHVVQTFSRVLMLF